MMFSQTTEYALRAVVFLTEGATERYTTHAIAKATSIPPGYLAKVLQHLAAAGIVMGQRGVNGGFILARDPASISVLEVIQAVEPIKRIHKCPLNLEAHRLSLCPLHARLDEALALVEDTFRRSTLADLLHRPTFRSESQTSAGK